MRHRPVTPPAREFADFVEHPRFGRGSRFTGLDVTPSHDGTVYCHWHSPAGVRVPNTAILANVASQRPATLHVTHYFDAKRVCRKCGRPFLFFAEEQKHWYEELKFPLEADCLDCATCRRDEHRLRALREKYDALLAQTARTETDTLELVDCALSLIESAVFTQKLRPRLRGFLKPLLANAEGPNYTKAQTLVSRISVLTTR